jgi:signal transduction histidine kinase
VDSKDWLVGGGEMGHLVRSKDWAKTPLGPIESWPQSLRTTVSLCLASNFPISLAWGPKHIQIYNDGYWPICGGKHPESMGQDFTECWASPWPVIGEAFESALAGTTSYLENQRMFLDRNGFPEETFFTFSFSPIRDESGSVGGLFHPVTETTAKMVGERHTRALRELASHAAKSQTTEEAIKLAAQTLAEFDLDVPFVLFYLLDWERNEARLVTATPSLPDSIAIPLIDLGLEDSVWPLAKAASANQRTKINDLEMRFGAFSCGPYPETPKSAVALPITPAGCERPLAILVAGVSSRLPFSEAYGAFYDLLAGTITSSVNNARAYEEERKRAAALAEIDRVKTAFFSNVSHEFRTPLTLMLGPLEDELAETTSAPRTRERIETAHRNALRLLKLVNTLLDFSRIESERSQARYEATDLASYTAELASVFRSAIERAGLSLSVGCPSLPEPVYVDREMWEKIVLNLLSNAVKHTFDGGITVTLKWCGDFVELAVSDSGVGISPTELPRVFDRFHRVKGARSRSFEGTGIGLALVQEMVHAHGGKVRAESQEGEGTTFFVIVRAGTAHLPPEHIGPLRSLTSAATNAAAYQQEAMLWVSDDNATSSRQLALAEPNGDSGGGSVAQVPSTPRSRILWADDNADMRDYVRRLLADRYEVTAVPDGEVALAAALANPPDLVLTDVMMPGLDGFGLLRELRANRSTHTIPVILLSARAGEESAVEGLEAGADDYLVKPFSARELLARVRTHLEMAKARRAWVIELEAANKDLEAFSSSVSHDLRGPLRSIDGFSHIVMEDYSAQLPEEAKHFLSMVRSSARQMNQLIDDLLRFSRLGRQRLSKKRISLAALVHSVVEELQREQSERQITIEVSDLPDCMADESLLKQVFVNLLSNAFKYTSRKENASVDVGCQQQNGEAIYFVRDNGAGFDAQHADMLFGVFKRFHRTDEFEGTG